MSTFKNFKVPCEKSSIVYFSALKMENTVPYSSGSKFPVKLLYCIAFWSAWSACCLVSFSITTCYYHFVLFFELIINYQTTTCVIISFSCCDFTSFIICSNIAFDWLIKKVISTNHNVAVFFLSLHYNILCILLYRFHFHTIKQKVYLLLENLH